MDSQIADDVVHETFLQLCKNDAVKIIQWSKEKDMVMRVAYQLAKQNLSTKERRFMVKLMFASTIKNNIPVSSTDEDDEENQCKAILIADEVNEDIHVDIWEIIESGLNRDEKKFMKWYLGKRKRNQGGNTPKPIKQATIHLISRIEVILKSNDIHFI